MQISFGYAQSSVAVWENPRLVDANKEAPHVSFLLVDRKEDVLSDDMKRSTFYQS